MKKRFVTILVSSLAAICLLFGFTACDKQGEACTHPAETTWSYDETHHWHNSTCDCNVKVDYAKHTIDDSGCCTVCEQAILPTDGVSYAVFDDGTYAKVVGYTGTATRVKIADTYEGLPVSSIDNNAFVSAKILSVIIPDSVTSIEYSAFYGCSSLTSVTIPDSVTSIGSGAFGDCSNLTSVKIPNSVTLICNYVFYGCSSLTSVTIGNGVTYIGDSAFVDCSSLTSVTIGDSVTSIGNYVFACCSRLTSMTIPDSVTSIGDGAFVDCDNLTSVTIGNNVTSIGDYAFYDCSSVTSVYYKGTASEWNNIFIGDDNSSLKNATRYYYSETKPATTGDYWHYVSGVPTIWS